MVKHLKGIETFLTYVLTTKHDKRIIATKPYHGQPSPIPHDPLTDTPTPNAQPQPPKSYPHPMPKHHQHPHTPKNLRGYYLFICHECFQKTKERKIVDFWSCSVKKI